MKADSFDEKSITAEKAAALEFCASKDQMVSKTGPEGNPFVDLLDGKDAGAVWLVCIVVEFCVCLADMETGI